MNTYLASAEPNMSVIILITGFVVVFAVLVLLIGIIWAYSKIVSSAQNTAKKRKEKKLAKKQAEVVSAEEASAPVTVSPNPVVSDGTLDLQTVAVITAAVEAFYGGCKVRVVGIRPALGTNTRSAWASAGLMESIPKMRSEGLL